MKKLVVLPALFLFLQQGFAQKKDTQIEWPWLINDIVYLSDSTGAGSVVFSNKEKKSGVVFVDQNGNAGKEVTFPGNVLGIGKWKGNIVAFYRDEWEHKNADKEIHAVMVDPVKGILLSDKLVYQNPGKTHLDVSVLKDNDGNFKCLLVRVSGRSGSGEIYTERAGKEMNATMALTALFFSDKLEPMQHQLSSVAVGGFYLSAHVNKKGELTVVSELNGQLVAEKYGQDGQLQKKLTTPIDFFEKNPFLYQPHTAGRFDPASDDILAYDIQHVDQKIRNNLLSLYVFDFGKGVVQTGENNVLDKNFSKELNLKDNLAVKPEHFGPISMLQPDAVFFIGDKLIVCNQNKYTSMGIGRDAAMRYDANGAIASVYDRQLHLLHRFFIDRTYEAFIDAGSRFSYCIRDGKLLMLGNIDEGIGYNNFYCILDPVDFRIERQMPAWGNMEKLYPVMPEAVFWFKKSIVKNHSAMKRLFGVHIKSFLVKADYE